MFEKGCRYYLTLGNRTRMYGRYEGPAMVDGRPGARFSDGAQVLETGARTRVGEFTVALADVRSSGLAPLQDVDL